MMYDWTIILLIPAMIFSLWASASVNSTFKKYAQQRPLCGMTGAQAARRVLDANGLQHIRIEHIPGELTDHYDPKANVIRLSDAVYDNASTAAIGVAAHEAGHAIQHAVGYAPIRLRTAIVPVTNIGSKLSMPLIIIGLVLAAAGNTGADIGITLAFLGVICFSMCVLFQLVTLPTEFNASRRALAAIQDCGLLSYEELAGSRKVLRAAAMTYVAALATAIMQLLRLIIIVAGRSRD